MRFKDGDITVGDVGINIVATADETLTGETTYFKFVKPSGATISRAAVESGYTATYTTVDGDIDEAGTWRIYLYNATTGFYYTKESGNIMEVRPKPEDMAAYE
jgi:hypothetical protein